MYLYLEVLGLAFYILYNNVFISVKNYFLVITFVQNNGTLPVSYLVNVNKFDRIHKIREALQRLLDVAAEEIILAEVFENHISRILVIFFCFPMNSC